MVTWREEHFRCLREAEFQVMSYVTGVLYCTLLYTHVQRSRSRVLEICHFTDLLRQELEDMEVASKLYCGNIALYNVYRFCQATDWTRMMEWTNQCLVIILLYLVLLLQIFLVPSACCPNKDVLELHSKLNYHEPYFCNLSCKCANFLPSFG